MPRLYRHGLSRTSAAARWLLNDATAAAVHCRKQGSAKLGKAEAHTLRAHYDRLPQRAPKGRPSSIQRPSLRLLGRSKAKPPTATPQPASWEAAVRSKASASCPVVPRMASRAAHGERPHVPRRARASASSESESDEVKQRSSRGRAEVAAPAGGGRRPRGEVAAPEGRSPPPKGAQRGEE